MCGRYALPIAPTTLPEYFGRQNLHVDQVIYSEKRTAHQYNIGPTAVVPVFILTSKTADKSGDINGYIEYMRWGLIPKWVKTRSDLRRKVGSTFNARVENLTSLSTWKSNVNNRCAVPVLGYYEWTHDKIKKPYYIKREDGELMFLAGLFSHGKLDNDTEETGSFTVITDDAPDYLKWLHPRMPIVLQPQDESFQKWIDPAVDIKTALELNKKNHSSREALEWYAVDRNVGDSRSDDKSYVLPQRNLILNFFKTKAKTANSKKRSSNDGDGEKNKRPKIPKAE
ncbi:Embryonic stem cell-specific 5-hydroxymethylcytosine-binding protein [Pichia kudriavzevii]|uniref:Embryonic stem cell-specific 5-hydroxymethylcytosine-binding protein n=1 Tax=Pichia kudriavzevii TaxID=4909 RepID=A0A1V2LR23_PICKU|nr:Embryonic stem cell-specific 5-hydroxymethylcytosine-binding protein [Pichia kudriavzevii]